MNVMIEEHRQQYHNGDGEEAHVAQERPTIDFERLDDAHRTHNTRYDERSCAKEFAYG